VSTLCMCLAGSYGTYRCTHRRESISLNAFSTHILPFNNENNYKLVGLVLGHDVLGLH